MRNAAHVAIGNMNPAGRYVADVVTVVRVERNSETNQLTVVLTTVGKSAQARSDADDMITIDLDAPAAEMVKQLGESKSSILRALFGGIL